MSKNKTPCLFPVELQWDTPYGPLKIWAKTRLIPSDVYTIAWDTDGLAVRGDDIILPGCENIYDIWWKAHNKYDRPWTKRTAKERADLRVLDDHLKTIERRTGLLPTSRYTVVPLRFLGHLAKLMRRDMYNVSFLPGKPLSVVKKFNGSIYRWAKLFSSDMITVRRVVDGKAVAEQATAELNEQLSLPEPNATDLLMAPQRRTLFPIQGAAVMHFSMTFCVERPRLYALCALLNPTLKEKHAALMLPDIITGGHGNSLVLTVEIPFLCNSFPLVQDGEYPNAASHDMAYEAVRRAEELAQKVYESLASKLETNDVTEQRALREAF